MFPYKYDSIKNVLTTETSLNFTPGVLITVNTEGLSQQPIYDLIVDQSIPVSLGDTMGIVNVSDGRQGSVNVGIRGESVNVSGTDFVCVLDFSFNSIELLPGKSTNLTVREIQTDQNTNIIRYFFTQTFNN